MQQVWATQQGAVASWGLRRRSRPVLPPISCSGAGLTSPGGRRSPGEALCSWVETRTKAWEAGGLWPKHELGWWVSFHFSVRIWSRFGRWGLDPHPRGGPPGTSPARVEGAWELSVSCPPGPPHVTVNFTGTTILQCLWCQGDRDCPASVSPSVKL